MSGYMLPREMAAIGWSAAVFRLTFCAAGILLAAVDAAVKSTPVVLCEVRLADDLGGHALALMSGDLTDTETALGICTDRAGDQLLTRTLLPWLDPNLRRLLDQGTRFSLCPAFEPAGAEHLEEVACSWDG